MRYQVLQVLSTAVSIKLLNINLHFTIYYYLVTYLFSALLSHLYVVNWLFVSDFVMLEEQK